MGKDSKWSRSVVRSICRHVEREMVRVVSDEMRPLLASAASAQVLLEAPSFAAGGHLAVPRRLSPMLCRVVGQAVAAACASIPIEARRTDMASLVQDVLARARVEHPRRRLTCTSAGDGRGVWDPERIKLLLATMIDFAFAGGDHTAPVTVEWRADAGTVFLEVENESLPFVYDHEETGTALPHSHVHWLEVLLARGVAHAHGGELDVRKGPGGGTVIVLALPREAPRRVGAVREVDDAKLPEVAVVH
jgi:hypothetical protein